MHMETVLINFLIVLNSYFGAMILTNNSILQ